MVVVQVGYSTLHHFHGWWGMVLGLYRPSNPESASGSGVCVLLTTRTTVGSDWSEPAGRISLRVLLLCRVQDSNCSDITCNRCLYMLGETGELAGW